MEYKLKSVAFHITDNCKHKCPMCYYTDKTVRCDGDIKTLKSIALELKKADVEEINLVGGDPAIHPQIEELVKYLHELGFRIPILSNTHEYNNSSIEKITPYVTSLEGTIHSHDPAVHDKFCGVEGAYNTLVNNLKKYSELKSDNQQLGIVMNVMRHNYKYLYASIETLLEQGLPIDYVLIQRIGAYGKASGTSKYNMFNQEIFTGFQNIDKINNKLGIETLMVDAFPYCIIPEQYHKYLSKCDWGYQTAAVHYNGDISRCAVAAPTGQNYLGNVLRTPVDEIWQNSPTLQKFRSKEYLRNECKECNMLEKCGGGCAISCGDGNLSTDTIVKSLKLPYYNL